MQAQMIKISQTVVGIPLRQTSPAAIERYLVEKIRAELGEFHDLVKINPVLRIDQADGDLSGNITNGFGVALLDVHGSSVQLPFIIHNKELLPFDVIRMGESEVSYDISKLRKIVNALDKKAKEGGVEGDDGETMEFVDHKDVPPSRNGFLGTIMDMRNDHAATGGYGHSPYEQLGFGTMDDERLLKGASANLDVLEVFEETIEKIANVSSYSTEIIDEYLTEIEKQAEQAAEEAIYSVTDSEESFEKSAVTREMDRLKNEKLVDISRVRSGNNIRFPIAESNTFEYRNGRVYHKLRRWSDQKGVAPKIKSLVVDSKGGYKFVRSTEKVMVTLEDTQNFDLSHSEARTLKVEHLYTTEINPEEAAMPFLVKSSFRKNQSTGGYSMPMYMDGDENVQTVLNNTLFSDALNCEEYLATSYSDNSWTNHQGFSILVSKDPSLDKVLHLNHASIEEYIETKTTSPDDKRLVNSFLSYTYHGDYYVVPAKLKFIHLEKTLTGTFSKPDGYFTEGPFAKTAAYNSSDSATLFVEKDSKPKKYGIKWQYAQEAERFGNAPTYNFEKKKMEGLSEAQAKKVLQDLGYDFRQVETFLEITQRNGRSASFRLPDIAKAKSVAPKDQAKNKAKKAFSNISNHTLNAQNFLPVFTDVISDSASDLITNVLPKTIEWTRKWDDMTKAAYETAVEIEKVAGELNGATWHELSALTNLKYRLDKMASEIANGAYLSGADEVFESVKQLEPAIEKQAKDLISFNRKQILNYDKPPVNPLLIKQAVAALDGLSKYASVHETLKKKDELTKEAGLFKKINPKDVEQFSTMINQTQKTIDELSNEFTNKHIYLRTLRSKKSNTTSKELVVEQRIDELKSKIDNEIQKKNQMVESKNKLFADQRDDNRKKVGAIGLPGIAAISYGFESAKD